MSQENKNTSTKVTNSNATKKDGGKGDAPTKKALTLTISFSTATTFFVVLLGCVCMAFVMGVIVGRGDNPEAHLPQIAALMPADDNKTPATPKDNTDSGSTSKVMPAEELDYSSILKNRAEVEPLAEEKNADVVSSAITELKQVVNKQEDVKTAVEEVEKPVAVANIFDFIFQVATFKEDASVDRLREQLEGKGLRTKMEKAGKFYRVLVLMRGTEEQAQTLQELMVEMKLGKPLQRGKKAI